MGCGASSEKDEGQYDTKYEPAVEGEYDNGKDSTCTIENRAQIERVQYKRKTSRRQCSLASDDSMKHYKYVTANIPVDTQGEKVVSKMEVRTNDEIRYVDNSDDEVESLEGESNDGDDATSSERDSNIIPDASDKSPSEAPLDSSVGEEASPRRLHKMRSSLRGSVLFSPAGSMRGSRSASPLRSASPQSPGSPGSRKRSVRFPDADDGNKGVPDAS
jgi:hypothetical protein